MATLAELRQCCEELGIESSALTREDMEGNIRTVFDKRYAKRKAPISADQFSEPLLKFLIKEFDWVLKNKEGQIITLGEYKKLERKED
uniref:Uncharacterized protein n=1 Tax=viral metagenome TaxID=1070528 RepID=A0A6M3K4L4_9ZZZZ